MSEFLRFSYTVIDEGPVESPYDPSNLVVSHFVGLDGASVHRQAQACVTAARVKGHEVKMIREELQPVELRMSKPDGELL